MLPRRWRGLLARLSGGILLVGLAVAAFVVTRPEDDPPPPTTTTTTFPEAAYVEAMSGALRAQLPDALDEPGSRCIAQALLVVLGPEALHELTAVPDPLGSLTPLQREHALRTVVTCLDPAVAGALLGGGAPVTQVPVTLPDEDG